MELPEKNQKKISRLEILLIINLTLQILSLFTTVIFAIIK